MKWWSKAHDALLLEAIQKQHWIWAESITPEICKITPEEAIGEWRVADPKCNQYAWYNMIMYFAVARAKELGYDQLIRKPQSRQCAACGGVFVEDSIPSSVVRHLRIDQIDVCLQCINRYFYVGADRKCRQPRGEILGWIRRLCNELDRVPPQSILGTLTALTPMSTEERVNLLSLVEGKPTLTDIEHQFGSWLGALAEAGVLEGGVRGTSRGTQCIARDGHVCFSCGEKTIDDLLSVYGIAHEKEPGYPRSSLRADFQIGDYHVEYFGLAGDSEYDTRSRGKERIAEEAGIPLIVLSLRDVLSERRILKKLKPAIGSLDA